MKKSGSVRIITPLLFVLIGFALFKWALAGDLNPLSGPSDAGSAMYTLDDIYNRLSDNTIGTKRSGGFEEPTAAPGATGHTLDELYNLAIPTQVPITGQTTSAFTGDDGDLQTGVAVPVDRFTDNGDGTVTDHLTGLIWLQDANANGADTWTNSLTYANTLADDGTNLTDGSSAGDWRLPNIKELQSLIDYGKRNPALPTGHPFTNVRSPLYYVECTFSCTVTNGKGYWTGTMQSGSGGEKVWSVNMYYGQPALVAASTSAGVNYYLWPVRGGH